MPAHVMLITGVFVLLKPNSITLAGLEPVRSWFEPDSVMKFGFYAQKIIYTAAAKNEPSNASLVFYRRVKGIKNHR